MRPAKSFIFICLNAFLFLTTLQASLLTISLSEEPIFEVPVSQLATQNQFLSSDFSFWSSEIKEPVRFHRKLWEMCYVPQVLKLHGFMKPGDKGLGFAVGAEPLPALFAKYGCSILATDQDLQSAINSGWAQSGQYAKSKAMLNSRGICNSEQFDRLVDLRCMDMNNIDKDLFGQFDFVWSCCSFEHLGSIKAGLDFVKNSMHCLKPGGIAIHTTEYNLSSLTNTLTKGGTVIFRRGDMIDLALDLIEMGYEVYEINFNRGSGELDAYIDCPPYKSDPHIKLQIASFHATSIGLIIRKPTQ